MVKAPIRQRRSSTFRAGSKSILVGGLASIALFAATRSQAQTCTLSDGTLSPASCYDSNPANWPPPARPYFMVVFDTSGSMIQCTTPPTLFADVPNSCPPLSATSPNNACGLRPTRINDGKCALRRMVTAFSEVDFGLTTFTQTITGCGTTSPYSCSPYVVDGYMPELANGCSTTYSCSGTGAAAIGGTVRVGLPVTATTVSDVIKWTDDDCSSGVELIPAGATPINGSLRDAAAHLRANAVAALKPSCRPVNVILITDGGESCDGDPTTNRAQFAAQDLYNAGLNDGTARPVKVFPIGFGGVTAAEKTALDNIAKMGQCGTTTGTCAAAVSGLVASNEAQLSQALAKIIGSAIQPEECDNVDNNCNGCVDEGYQHYCNTQPIPANCCNWATTTARNTCLTNFRASITALVPDGDLKLLPCANALQGANCSTWLCNNPKDTCDNLDNNCSSGIDEGATKCNNKCPSAETCNNLDDDCDGTIDNKPGLGAYSLDGCTKCIPTTEICDGCDNDCDGIADNGVPTVNCGLPTPPNCAGTQKCATSVNVGVGKCVNGGPGNFYGTCVTSALKEVCDGEDNDCNGQIDDALLPTLCEIPGQPGLKYKNDGFAMSQCVKGQKPCNGQCAGWIGPSQEICDGIDNDCDGLTDSQDPGLLGTGVVCGVLQGECTKGTTACVGGALVCETAVTPQVEVCDGKDNDCNGFVDDGLLVDGPSAQDKPCWNLPTGTCATPCSYLSAQWCPPAGASCHGAGPLTEPCALGSLSCQSGAWKCLGGLGPSKEVCDGIDNDCNGAVDNNLTTAICGSDKGECKIGTQECLNGKVECNGGVNPVQETCDNKDNDCDGVIDNGIAIGDKCFPSYDVSLYPGIREKGLCKPGVSSCGADGKVECNGGIGPSPEVCDGLDNDCDGDIDEVGDAPNGINGTTNPKDSTQKIGDACGKDVGLCTKGAWACSLSTGSFVCQGGTAAQVEVCDCFDNDCDGLTDEDPTTGTSEPVLCGTGKVCVSYKDSCQCAPTCKAGEFPCPTGEVTCEAVNKSGKTPPETAGKRCVADPDAICGDCTKQTVVGSNGTVECAPAGTVLDSGLTPPVCECKGQKGCHNPCFERSCTGNSICTDFGANAGSCVEDNCWNIPCAAGKACTGGTCKTTPCLDGTCPSPKACKASADYSSFTCIDSCANIKCNANEVCKAGVCQATGCAQACPTGKVCSGGDAGACVDSKCTAQTCPNGSYCDPVTGSCGDDPCASVKCPKGQACKAGECALAADAGSDADAETGTGGSGGGTVDGSSDAKTDADGGTVGPQTDPKAQGNWGLATGGGGCSCETKTLGARDLGNGGLLAFVFGALFAARRKNAKRTDKRAE